MIDSRIIDSSAPSHTHDIRVLYEYVLYEYEYEYEYSTCTSAVERTYVHMPTNSYLVQVPGFFLPLSVITVLGHPHAHTQRTKQPRNSHKID